MKDQIFYLHLIRLSLREIHLSRCDSVTLGL